MQKLPQFKGHFFNWYGTQDLHPLNPAYVSSVDSGNLAGHLIVLVNACEEWMETATAPHARLGMMDHLQLACHARSEEHTSELQSLMRLSYADFCLEHTKKTHRKQ